MESRELLYYEQLYLPEKIGQVFGTALFTRDFPFNDKASHATNLSWF
jgi:hypothetical protein